MYKINSTFVSSHQIELCFWGAFDYFTIQYYRGGRVKIVDFMFVYNAYKQGKYM
jgi:hypothetical protein